MKGAALPRVIYKLTLNSAVSARIPAAHCVEMGQAEPKIHVEMQDTAIILKKNTVRGSCFPISRLTTKLVIRTGTVLRIDL